ncbi:hypothetical protein C8Q76DRAFT_176338 [Earliella scabrosa]|nr:hypothetical protein C8Q76DRAFT_176338 [Earliella scabrosa]
MAGFWPALIQKWGSLQELGTLRETNLHRIWVVCLVTFIVQSFYFYRIYRLIDKRWRIAGIVLAPLVLWQIILAPIYVKLCFDDLSFATLFSPRSEALVISLRVTTAVVDIVIMVAMTWLLLRHQNSEFRRTSKMLDRLVMITVNTGVWTALLAIVDLALLLKFKNGIQWCITEFPIGPLYVNAFLANLNARSYVRNDLPTWNSIALESGTGGLSVRSGSMAFKPSHSQSKTVHVSTETSVHSDLTGIAK